MLLHSIILYKSMYMVQLHIYTVALFLRCNTTFLYASPSPASSTLKMFHLCQPLSILAREELSQLIRAREQEKARGSGSLPAHLVDATPWNHQRDFSKMEADLLSPSFCDFGPCICHSMFRHSCHWAIHARQRSFRSLYYIKANARVMLKLHLVV